MITMCAVCLMAIAGCGHEAKFTEKEAEQIKAGRTEPPPEARKMMEDIATGRMKPTSRPPGAGKPGPGPNLAPPIGK